MSQSDTQTEIVWVREATEQWDELREAFMEAQNDLCAICHKRFEDLPVVDHCHASGFVRGALCNSCNTKLGWFEKHRHAIDAYLHRASEYQAYRLGTKPKPELPAVAKAKKYGPPDWVRRYWQTKHLKPSDRAHSSEGNQSSES